MRTPPKILIISLCLFLASFCAVVAGETRDGSTEQKAIIVPASISDAKAREWQRRYLETHFPEHFSLDRGLNAMGEEEHAFIGHDKQRRWYDYYSFRVRGKKIEVYFDVSKQTLEWGKAHGLMP